MKYYFCAFRLALAAGLKRRASLICMLLAAAVTLAALLIPGSAEAAVRVGVVLPRDGGGEFLALLQQRSSELIRFVPAGEQELERKILSGEWDCGLVLEEDFQEELESLSGHALMKLKVGPGSAVYPLVRETAAACLMELMAPKIARDYLEKNSMDTLLLEQRLEQIGRTAPRVRVVLETLDGGEMEPLDLTRSQGKRMLRGLTAVLLVIWGLLLAVDSGRWLRTGAARRMWPVRSAPALLLPRLSAGLLPVTVWAMGVNGLLGSWRGAAALPLLAAVVLGESLLLARLPGLLKHLPVLTPVAAVFTLVLEPVLVDTASLLPQAAAFTRWLPVSAFLRASEGSLPALALLAAQAAALLALGARIRKREG